MAYREKEINKRFSGTFSILEMARAWTLNGFFRTISRSMKESKSYRKTIIEYLELLSSPSKQIEYEKSLAIAGCAHDEIFSIFLDDSFHPKSNVFIDSFSEPELLDLCELYGILCLASRSFEKTSDQCMASLHKNEVFRLAMAFAQNLHARLRNDS